MVPKTPEEAKLNQEGGRRLLRPLTVEGEFRVDAEGRAFHRHDRTGVQIAMDQRLHAAQHNQ